MLRQGEIKGHYDFAGDAKSPVGDGSNGAQGYKYLAISDRVGSLRFNGVTEYHCTVNPDIFMLRPSQLMTTDSKTLTSQVADIDWEDWTDEDIAWEAMWKSLLESGDNDLHQYLVEGQSEVVSLAAAALTPILIAFAQSQLPHHELAFRILASILSSRGQLEYEQQQSEYGPVPNPFKPGEIMDLPGAPDPSDLEDEAILIHDMKKEIEAATEAWVKIATSGAPEVSLAALGLLAEISHSPQMELAEETIEAVFESASPDERDKLWYVMERMEAAKQCSFCLSLGE